MGQSADYGRILRSLDNINFVQIAIIMVATWLLIRITSRALPWLATRAPTAMRVGLLGVVPVLRLALLAVALVLIVQRVIELTVANVMVLFGAASVAIGFAFKDYVSSLIAGIVTVTERPYRPGDWVTLDGTYGEVKSIGLRAMELVTPDDDLVTIPHTKLWSAALANSNSGEPTLMCVTDFYLARDHDAERVVGTLRDVALTSAYLLPTRPIAVVAMEKPWATHYRVKAYPIDAYDQFRFITDLTVRGKAALAAIGAEPATAPPAVLQGDG